MASLQLKATDVVLVRHGQTEWSRSGQHTGRTDIPLTAEGEESARRLAPVLSAFPFSQVLTSPLQRARRTCELAGFADQALIEPDLLEWNYGAYEGLTTAEIRFRAPDWLVFSDGCPDGESPAEVCRRVDLLLERVRAERGPTLLFAHGHLLRVLVARWLELPPREGRRFLLDTATLNVLSYYRGIPALGCWNAPAGV
jgi:broad specificity phosphatase PhoE